MFIKIGCLHRWSVNCELVLPRRIGIIPAGPYHNELGASWMVACSKFRLLGVVLGYQPLLGLGREPALAKKASAAPPKSLVSETPAKPDTFSNVVAKPWF